jgi:aarF domain-containing kinase
VGNIEDDMYPILESAITGQMNMAEAGSGTGPASLLESGSDDHVRKLRKAMMEQEGLILSIFELLRTVPR